MEVLKKQCQIKNPQLGENLRIEFDIRMEGKVMELWSASPMGGKIKAQVGIYGDDGHQGDTLLHTFDYPMKLSNPGADVLEEKAMIPVYGNSFLDEDKKGRDEVYALFYLTMTFKTIDDVEVDAVISNLVRTNTLKKEFAN